MTRAFLAALDIFEDLGKEVFCFLVLCVTVPLLLAHFVDGGQYVDLVKSLGLAYLSATTVDKTAEKVRDLWQKKKEG
jgi:hypothetical protein